MPPTGALHRAPGRVWPGSCRRRRRRAAGLFHGRGGTVGPRRRPGATAPSAPSPPAGPTTAASASPSRARVISFRYAPARAGPPPPRAGRQRPAPILGRRPSGGDRAAAPRTGRAELMERARPSARWSAYRGLLDDPQGALALVRRSLTPVAARSVELPIASRPVSRSAGAVSTSTSLRAIPWVFAWTQTRYLVPGWFGTGPGARGGADGRRREARSVARQRRYREAGLRSATVVDNAQLEMARARLPVARRYAELAEDGGETLHRTPGRRLPDVARAADPRRHRPAGVSSTTTPSSERVDPRAQPRHRRAINAAPGRAPPPVSAQAGDG